MSERVRNWCPAELHQEYGDHSIFYCVLDRPHDVHQDAYGHEWTGMRGLLNQKTVAK